MLWQSALESAIQVAIAIAGFSGIVAAVGRRGAGHWTQADQLLLRILLTSAGVALVYAFLPFVLVDAIDPSAAWRIASGLMAVWTTFITIYRRWQASRIPGTLPSWPPLVILPILVVLTTSANALWFATPWLYVTGVLYSLLISFLTFVRLLLRSWQPLPEAAARDAE